MRGSGRTQGLKKKKKNGVKKKRNNADGDRAVKMVHRGPKQEKKIFPLEGHLLVGVFPFRNRLFHFLLTHFYTS